MLIGGLAQQRGQRNTAQQPNMLRRTQQQSMDPYVTHSQSGMQPGTARSVQPAHKRPWKPSMGLVPSSQASSMPPRPASATGGRRLARPAEGQMQALSQPRMTMSQPNSFQEYAPTGTPDRQYMLPADHRTGNAAYHMPSSQPSSGVDSADYTPARPSSTQSFSQARPAAISPGHQQRQRYSQLPPSSSMRPIPGSQRQPSAMHMQERRMLAQQQPIRATQRPLQFTASQAGSQTLTPQSSQTQRSSQVNQYSQAVQSSQGLQLQSSQGLQISDSQDLLMESSQAAQSGGSHGRHATTHNSMLAQTTRGMHVHMSQGLPSSQLEQGNQPLPPVYLTQPSQDTIAWSEETQADPPPAVSAPSDAQARHHFTGQQGLLKPAQQPVTDLNISEDPEHTGSAAAAAAADAAVAAAPPSRLRMKMKSLAAAAAINQGEAVIYASSADDASKQDIDALPSGSLPAPAAGLADHSEDHRTHPPGDHHGSNGAEQAAGAEAAAVAAAEAAKAAAAQVNQALAAATAAQDDCKAMAAAAAAAATADKENQEARHAEVLSKIAGVQGSCTTMGSALATLQDAQAAKLSLVESTCQTLLGLLHGLAAQTQQAVTAFEAHQVQQPAVTVLRCLESATQTSPVSLRHQAVQAELSIVTMRPSPGAQKGLPVEQTMWTSKQSVANAPNSTAQPRLPVSMPQKASGPVPSQLNAQPQAEAMDMTPVHLQGNGGHGQDRPGQKRTRAVSELQQQKVKRQRVVYSEFSTSTESATESDCSAPSVCTEDECSPREQPAHHAKMLQSQQQQQQQHTLPGGDLFKLRTAPAARHDMPVSPPDKDKVGSIVHTAGCDWGTSGSSQLKAYSHARKANQPQKAPAAASTAQGVLDRAQQPSETTPAHAAEAAGLAACTRIKYSAVQEGKRARPPTTAGGFEDLLQAVLGQDDCYLGPRTQHGTANPALDSTLMNLAPKPSALGDVTNTQRRVGGSAPKHPAGKACAAAPAADKACAKPSAQNAMEGVSKAESKGASRRCARVQAKKQQSQADKQQHSATVELFSDAYQELMPSIDDEDIERQVKERMQRHRLKNQKHFSRMKP